VNESTWNLEIDEVSAGVYKITALHTSGAKYEVTGIDPDELRERARRAMSEIDFQMPRKIT
jgi:hypothetical protein